MIAVVIPCYRVKHQILGVLSEIGPECEAIFVVDDSCPEETGNHVEKECDDPRVRVLRHATNLGVGGATITGYEAALQAGAEVIVKIDGDEVYRGKPRPDFVTVLETFDARLDKRLTFDRRVSFEAPATATD